MLCPGVVAGSLRGGVSVRSDDERTERDGLPFLWAPFVRGVRAFEPEEDGRMFGSEMTTAEGLLDILEAMAAVRARW